jgi:hypothetical protein
LGISYEMWDIIKGFAVALIPPRDGDAERSYKWRVTVATLIFALGGVTLANTVLTWGMVPWIFLGFARVDTVVGIERDQVEFARKADVAKITAQIDRIGEALTMAQIATLDQQIYNLRVMQCNAIKNGNREASLSHGDQLRSLQAQFRVLAQYDYPLRPCSEL